MPNTIDDLRAHLFDTLKALKDPEKPMEVDRAKSIADVARVIVDTAKVEVQLVNATGAVLGSGFIPTTGADRQLPPDRPQLPGKRPQ